MKNMIGVAVVFWGMCCFASAFMWAAFDVSWWVPMDGGTDGRAFVFWVLHFVGAALGSGVAVHALIDD